MPVRVTFAGHRPSLPRVQVTRLAPGVAEGNLTAGSAVISGAALKRQFQRGHVHTERVWTNPVNLLAGGSGCSAYVARPTWRHSPDCPGRTAADVAAVAANIPIYNRAWGGWLTFEGTSASPPLVAGFYGLAGNAAHITVARRYQHHRDFFDVTRGNNAQYGDTPRQARGNGCLCVAKPGYDAPTGLGTPDGAGVF